MFIRNHRCSYPLQTWSNADASSRVIWTSPEENFGLLFWTYSSIFYSRWLILIIPFVKFLLAKIILCITLYYLMRIKLKNVTWKRTILCIFQMILYISKIYSPTIVYLLQALYRSR